MKITIESKERYKTYRLYAEFDVNHTILIIDNNNIYNGPTDSLISLIEDYNEISMIEGLPYYSRKIFTQLIKFKIGENNTHLFRSFVVITMFLHINMMINNSDNIGNYYKYLHEQCNKVLYDFSMFEKTGNIGPQPTIYFLKKDIITSEKAGIDYLFSLGLLSYFKISFSNNEYTSYFMPFELPNIPNYKLFRHIFLWNTLLRDRGNEIQKFIEGNK